MFDRNGWVGNPGFPYIPILSDVDTKMNHDSYEVYVNKNYVGNKTLVAQGENIYDVADYLKEQGFDRFNSHLTGNSFSIEVDNREESKKMKETLSAYLQIR